jgi:putative peptide zinc metalloprotease protein
MLLVLPFAYADVTSSYLFEKKSQRVLVIAAGFVATLVAAATAAYLSLLVPSGATLQLALITVALLQIGMAALNAIPFLRLDGYFLLAELVGVNDLRPRAIALVVATAGGIVGRPAEPSDASDRERRILSLYALGNALFVVAVVGGIAWVLW